MKTKMKNSKEVIQLLREKMVDVWDGPFDVDYKDGLMHVYVETENPGSDTTGLWDHFPGMNYRGYHMVIVKTPLGYLNIGSENESR